MEADSGNLTITDQPDSSAQDSGSLGVKQSRYGNFPVLMYPIAEILQSGYVRAGMSIIRRLALLAEECECWNR